MTIAGELERKDMQAVAGARMGLRLTEDHGIEGYASLFGKRDQGGDVVVKGAYAASLKRLAAGGRAVKESYRKQKGIFLKYTKVNYKLYTYGSRATSNKRVYMSVPVCIYSHLSTYKADSYTGFAQSPQIDIRVA